MKRSQAKKNKIETYEIDKISLSCFDNKWFALDDGIHTLAYFHKDSDNIKLLWSMKGIIIIERYYNHWKILWSWKNIVIIKKDCNNGKILW